MKHDARKYVVMTCLVSLPIVFAQSSADRAPNATTQASSDHNAAIFRKSCSVCHSIRPGETKIGPSLYGVLREGSGHSEQAIRQAIANGKGTMPAFREKLDPGEIDDLVEFLRTL